MLSVFHFGIYFRHVEHPAKRCNRELSLEDKRIISCCEVFDKFKMFINKFRFIQFFFF